jgi:hypothetical protein
VRCDKPELQHGDQLVGSNGATRKERRYSPGLGYESGGYVPFFTESLSIQARAASLTLSDAENDIPVWAICSLVSRTYLEWFSQSVQRGYRLQTAVGLDENLRGLSILIRLLSLPGGEWNKNDDLNRKRTEHWGRISPSQCKHEAYLILLYHRLQEGTERAFDARISLTQHDKHP